MAIPELAHLDAVRKLRGDALVTFPGDDKTKYRVQRVFTIPRPADFAAGLPDYLTPDLQYPDAKLTSQIVTGGDMQNVEVLRTWEILPGVPITTTRTVEDGKVVTVTSQRMTIADITAALATDGHETMSAFPGPFTWTRRFRGEGGSVVATLVTETRVIPGNVRTDSLRDATRGKFTRETELIRAADVPAGGADIVESSGTITETRYVTVPGSTLVKKKMVDTWALASALTRTTIKRDPEMNTDIKEERVVKKVSDITPSTAATAGTSLVIVEREEYAEGSADIAVKVTTTITAPVAKDLGSAILGTKTMAYEYPARINFLQLDLFGSAIGYKAPKARLVDATVKTWWVINDTKPTLTFDRIIPDDMFVNNRLYNDVLHDATTRTVNGFPFFFPATIPSYTQYNTSWLNKEKLIDGGVKDTRYHKLWKVEAVYLIMR